jgi:hypothetical protein
MFAKAKGIVIAACVLLCTLSLMGGRSNVPPRPRASVGQPFGSAVGAVLVEAFVVDVNLPALAKLEVSPIGQEPHAVSVADILKCLDTGQARVIGGGKAASQPDARTTTQATRTTYIKCEKGTPPEASYTPYQLGRRFSVGVSPASDTAVSVQFSYTHTRVTQNVQTTNVPPDTESWEWSSAAVLELGKPQIVAASQDGEEAVFLLLTAHIPGE